jgi:hypothetical protein
VFVDRDNSGNVTGAYVAAQHEGQESVADDNADLLAFWDRLANPIPQTASAGDFMRALYELGWYDDVVAAVEADGEIGKILWARASLFERNHALVAQIATAINKTPDDLDALFRKAASYG